MHKKSLWLRLRDYHFDHVVSPGLWDQIRSRFGHTNPSLRAFAGKIARKHGWTLPFALQAIQEYKKFVYLGTVSDFQVTPSKVIDTVWHEHILFSKAYRDFCHEVVKEDFDHHPELVPMEDQTGRFSAQYLDTLALYQSEFNSPAPQPIWGDPKFDQSLQESSNYQSARKKRKENNSIDYSSEAPLHTGFSAETGAEDPGFNGFEGGDFGGAGAGGDWSDSGSDSGADSGGDGGGCSGGCGGGD